ncbi:hypothetical protein ABFG93_03385 [Pseudalkalibacillus hwajinpoensis]|uniref:hypothetical protein n=1 Tax=Guptibacillus hwajinpoensis TaxID=208199 RepID=UPI00325AA040
MLANIDTGKSFTFRSGQIGSWKKEFDEEVIQLFKKNANEFLIEMGYESDECWSNK